MSVDQEASDAWNAATTRGLRRGVRPVWMQSGPIVEGRRRWFAFEYEPIGKRQPQPAARSDAPRRVTRGAARDPVQTPQGRLF